MKDKTDRRIFTYDSIVYIDNYEIISFEDVLKGEIAESVYDDGEKLGLVDNTVKLEGKYLKEHHKEKWGSLNKGCISEKYWRQNV